MNWALLALILFFALFSSTAFGEAETIVINEIMYNPQQNDDYNEWIEIYNPGSGGISIENWTLCGKKLLAGYVDINGTVRGRTSLILPAGGYAIITDGGGTGTEAYDNFNISGNAINVHPDAASLCSGALPNDKEKSIVLKDAAENLIENITYSPAWGANGNGKTLERNTSGWFESITLGGTPGQNNSILFAAPTSQSQNESAPESASQEPQNTENTSTESASFGSPSISIISAPSSLRFGDYSSIQAQFYSGDSSFSEARIVAYVFSPHWISRELSRDDSTLRNTPYMSNVAAAIYNVPANSTANIVLPLFLKCNKGAEFPEGSYSLRIRLYKYDGSWNSAAEKDTELSVGGENPLCSAEVVYVNVTNNVTNKCPACPKQNISIASSKMRDEDIVFSTEVPGYVFLGDNFTANITLKNNGGSRMFLEAYSYLHDHEKLLSQGFDGSSWRNTWAANSRKIELAPNETGNLSLLNAPKNMTLPGTYTYRIVVSDMNASKILKEANYLINVKEKPKEEAPRGNVALSIAEPKNATEITGRAVSTQARASVFGRIINWFKGFF